MSGVLKHPLERVLGWVTQPLVHPEHVDLDLLLRLTLEIGVKDRAISTVVDEVV